MSMVLAAKAWELKLNNPIRKMILIKLADNANDKGECWPSYQHIADHCEIHRSTVIRHIEALEKMGLLTKTKRKGPKGNSSNLFILHLDNQQKNNVITSSTVRPTLVAESDQPSSTVRPTLVAESDQPSSTVRPRTSHRTSHIEPINETNNTHELNQVKQPDSKSVFLDKEVTSDDIPTPTLERGAIAAYCRSQGINATPSHALQKLIDQGAVMQHFVDAVVIAKDRGNSNWAYVLGIVRNLLAEEARPQSVPNPRPRQTSSKRFDGASYIYQQARERINSWALTSSRDIQQQQEVTVNEDGTIFNILGIGADS